MAKGDGKSFVTGAAVLAVGGLVGKVAGMVYRILLASVIGAEGIGLYQKVYPIYAMLLVVSTAGIPTAIAKLISERLARGDEAAASATMRLSSGILVALGIITTLALVLLAGPISLLVGSAETQLSLYIIAPSLLLVALMSAYRGWFQGRQNMTPTAVSQVVEQILKLAVGVAVAAAWSSRGPAYGAAGAFVGVTVSEAGALALIMGGYGAGKRGRAAPSPLSSDERTNLVKRLLAIAVPITLGASIMPLVNAIDAVLVSRRLADIGIVGSQATEMFGVLNGAVNPIINMPSVLSLSLSVSLVPAISAAVSGGKRLHASASARAGIKLAVMIGLPCSVGLYLLADPILRVLYSSYSAEHLALGGEILRLLAVAVLFLTMVQTTTGIMQGYGSPITPVKTLALGAVIKIIASYVLIGIPSIGIMGAPIGTLMCYGVAAVLNAFLAGKRAGDMRWGDTLLRPTLAALGMGAAVLAVQMVLRGQRDIILVAACLCVGIFAYFILIFATRSLTKEDLPFFPGGARLEKLMQKLRLLRG